MNCPRCGGGLKFISGDFWTGIESGGYKEMRYEEGYECERCFATFDIDDIEHEESESQHCESGWLPVTGAHDAIDDEILLLWPSEWIPCVCNQLASQNDELEGVIV